MFLCLISQDNVILIEFPKFSVSRAYPLLSLQMSSSSNGNGHYPVNGAKVLQKRENNQEVPDMCFVIYSL